MNLICEVISLGLLKPSCIPTPRRATARLELRGVIRPRKEEDNEAVLRIFSNVSLPMIFEGKFEQQRSKSSEGAGKAS